MKERAKKKTVCAVYARYSSDLQSDTSIEDQMRNCVSLRRAKVGPFSKNIFMPIAQFPGQLQ